MCFVLRLLPPLSFKGPRDRVPQLLKNKQTDKQTNKLYTYMHECIQMIDRHRFQRKTSIFMINKYPLSVVNNVLIFIWLYHILVEAMKIQFPDQRSNRGPPALGVWTLSHWTTRNTTLTERNKKHPVLFEDFGRKISNFSFS